MAGTHTLTPNAGLDNVLSNDAVTEATSFRRSTFAPSNRKICSRHRTQARHRRAGEAKRPEFSRGALHEGKGEGTLLPCPPQWL